MGNGSSDDYFLGFRVSFFFKQRFDSQPCPSSNDPDIQHDERRQEIEPQNLDMAWGPGHKMERSSWPYIGVP